VESLVKALDPEQKYEHVEAIAATGQGVFETLKLISKLTLRTLRRRMTGDEPVKPRKGLADVTNFRVKDEPATTATQPIPAMPAPPSQTTTAIGHTTSSSAGHAAPATAAASSPQSVTAAIAEELMDFATTDDELPDPTPAPMNLVTETTTPPPTAEPKVKHVKVRSSIDVMAELEALRKKATQTAPPKPKKEAPTATQRRVGRELHKALNITVPPEALAQAKAMRITVSFEDAEEGVVQQQSEKIELDGSDVESISLNVRIDQG
jgi:hypothetical protein